MDKRKEKSQKLIIRSFVELIREKDFDKISMNDIAQHANINRGTIYLNFIDKYDILDHAIDYILGAAVDKCNIYLAESGNNKETLREVMYVIDDQYDILKTLVKKSDLNMLKQTLSKKMRNTINKQNSEITAQFLSSAVVGVIIWWIEESKPCDIDTLVGELSVLLEPHLKHL
ncbi:TetR/AcrR family transcriptional regulator [Staphylococcus equorum]|uniref:TetR/AcrR family transcriptional regulator n=1 Tax=Staphylococcus equorum TaxID=246432 RepID=UPI000D1CC307|nr:TetR/AcrR family transcriptional regulator [Staphylococcus equorum]MDG0823897.1 TetR/AcrR family transcriptional regulator [Staphylococcus equorum]PTE82443.1 TetR family transcriptional regulator [Staphylococcus equorum]